MISVSQIHQQENEKSQFVTIGSCFRRFFSRYHKQMISIGFSYNEQLHNYNIFLFTPLLSQNNAFGIIRSKDLNQTIINRIMKVYLMSYPSLLIAYFSNSSPLEHPYASIHNLGVKIAHLQGQVEKQNIMIATKEQRILNSMDPFLRLDLLKQIRESNYRINSCLVDIDGYRQTQSIDVADLLARLERPFYEEIGTPEGCYRTIKHYWTALFSLGEILQSEIKWRELFFQQSRLKANLKKRYQFEELQVIGLRLLDGLFNRANKFMQLTLPLSPFYSKINIQLMKTIQTEISHALAMIIELSISQALNRERIQTLRSVASLRAGFASIDSFARFETEEEMRDLLSLWENVFTRQRSAKRCHDALEILSTDYQAIKHLEQKTDPRGLEQILQHRLDRGDYYERCRIRLDILNVNPCEGLHERVRILDCLIIEQMQTEVLNRLIIEVNTINRPSFNAEYCILNQQRILHLNRQLRMGATLKESWELDELEGFERDTIQLRGFKIRTEFEKRGGL